MHDTTITAERERSLRLVQTIFAALAASALLASLAFHFEWIGADLPADDISAVARAFLFLALADTALVFLWERIFPREK